MTRILLRPPELPPYPGQSAQLHGDWCWWRLRLQPGDELVRAYDPASDPDFQNIREISLTFNRDRDPDTTLVNPPVTRLITIQRVEDWGAPVYRSFLVGDRREVYIVWWGSPGPGWEPLPGNTCRPGEYSIPSYTAIEGERSGHPDLSDCYQRRYHLYQQRLLDWPHTVDFTEAQRFNREEIAAIFGLPPEILSPNRIRLAEGLRPVYEGPVEVQPPQFPRTPGLDRWGRPSQLQRYADPARHRELRPSVVRRNPNVLPEQDVVDEIDRLVNEQVSEAPRDDYRKDFGERCELCGQAWHGLTGVGAVDSFGHGLGQVGCPGAFAEEEEIRRWRGY